MVHPPFYFAHLNVQMRVRPVRGNDACDCKKEAIGRGSHARDVRAPSTYARGQDLAIF